MDAFYEESAINQNAVKEGRKYKIFHIASYVFLFLGIILLVMAIFNMPIGGGEEAGAFWAMFGFMLMQGLLFMGMWFAFYKIKSRYNVNFDYCFVTGELRISKVFNVNKRRLVARIDCEDMIQVGDVDNPSFDRFRADPTVKTVFCTPNVETSEGKFFMYVLANYNGRKLYVLECRENLLMNIMKFAKRSVLESDYVMQERKQK